LSESRPPGHPHLHDFVQSLRGALAVFACGLVGFTLLVPVSTVAMAERSVFNVNYTHDQLKFRFFDENLSLVVTLAALVYGAALALVLLRFLRDKRASGALLSCGIRRPRLFAHRFCVGVLFLIVAVGAPFAASLALNVAALDWYDGELASFFYVLSGYLACGLVAFSLTAIACICAGTLFECVAFAAALLASVSAIAWGLDALCAYLLVGSPFGKAPFGSDATLAPSLLEAASAFNPALFFNDLGATRQLFRVMHPVYTPVLGSWTPIVGWTLVALLVAVASSWALRLRPGEQAQMAGMNTPFAFFTVAIAAFLLFSALFFAVAPADVGVALALGVAAFVALSLFLLRGPLRGKSRLARSLYVLAAECACVGSCVAIIASGAFGFSAWIPASSEVASVEVSYVGTPSYLARPLSGTASNAAYYYHAEYRFDSAEDIEAVRAAHAGLIASARAPLSANEGDFSSSVIRYDMVVRYTLDDGSVRARYFDRVRISELESLLVLDDSARMAALEKAAITGDATGLSDEERAALASANTALAYRAGAVYVTDANYNVITALDLGEVARGELLRALAQDVAAQSARERYAQPAQPRAVLMFSASPQIDVASFGFSFSGAVVPIAPDFAQTQAWFEDNGLGAYLSRGVDAALIEELSWLVDDPYASVVNSASTMPTSRFFIGYRSEVPGRGWAAPAIVIPDTTRDSAEIAELAPRLRTACFMGGGYLVQAKLRGVDVWVYYYLPADEAPAFISGGSGMSATGSAGGTEGAGDMDDAGDAGETGDTGGGMGGMS
jgi:ABC-2 type transport system permease protein